jgi:hypothetical protein
MEPRALISANSTPLKHAKDLEACNPGKVEENLQGPSFNKGMSIHCIAKTRHKSPYTIAERQFATCTT